MRSAIFATERLLLRLLREAMWPPLAESRGGVGVWLGDPEVPPASVIDTDESVVLIGQARSESEWATAGRLGQNETINARIGIRTTVPLRTEVQVLDRLEELAHTVDRLLSWTVRDLATDARPVELSSALVWQWEMVEREMFVIPADEGFVGTFHGVVRVMARLNEEDQ